MSALVTPAVCAISVSMAMVGRGWRSRLRAPITLTLAPRALIRQLVVTVLTVAPSAASTQVVPNVGKKDKMLQKNRGNSKLSFCQCPC